MLAHGFDRPRMTHVVLRFYALDVDEQFAVLAHHRAIAIMKAFTLAKKVGMVATLANLRKVARKAHRSLETAGETQLRRIGHYTVAFSSFGQLPFKRQRRHGSEHSRQKHKQPTHRRQGTQPKYDTWSHVALSVIANIIPKAAGHYVQNTANKNTHKNLADGRNARDRHRILHSPCRQNAGGCYLIMIAIPTKSLVIVADDDGAPSRVPP